MLNLFWAEFISLFVHPLEGLGLGVLIALVFVLPFYLAYYWISPDVTKRVRLDGTFTNTEKKFYWTFFIQYPVWGFLQQVLFVGIYVLLNTIWPQYIFSYNMLIASFIFMLAHIPNVFLMLLCFGFEFIILILMNEFHNIYLLGVIHGIIATCIGTFAPDVIITNYSINDAYARLFKQITKKD